MPVTGGSKQEGSLQLGGGGKWTLIDHAIRTLMAMVRITNPTVRAMRTSMVLVLLLFTGAFGCKAGEGEYVATNDSSEDGLVVEDKHISVPVDANAQADIDLLKWAVTHSGNASNDDLVNVKRQRATLNTVGVDADRLRDSIDFLRDLNQTTAGAEPENISNTLSVLATLAELVETVDAADYFLSYNGSDVVVPLLWIPEFRVLAAKVLIVGASNNAPFQQTLLEKHPRMVPDLINVLKSLNVLDSDMDSIWLHQVLQLTASLLRTSESARKAWLNYQGDVTLMPIISSWDKARLSKLQKRAIVLMTDLFQLTPPAVAQESGAQFFQQLLKIMDKGRESLTKEMEADDWDTAEKLLLALEALMIHTSKGQGERLQKEGHDDLLHTRSAEKILKGFYDSLVKARNNENGIRDEFQEEVIALSKHILEQVLVPVERARDSSYRQEL